MTDIKIVASGVCEACGHPQSDHEGCECTQIGSY